MSDLSQGIEVERSRGEQFRRALVEMGAYDRSRKIVSDQSCVYLPVLDLDEEAESRLRLIADFQHVEMSFQLEEHQKSLEEILGFRPGYEIVGDIAIVDDDDAERVAEALMQTCRSVRTVIAPLSDVEGEFRTRRFRHVAGEVGTITTHKEHGLLYRVDLEGAYFTPRLGTERLRVARAVQPGQVVLDMFAGIGPFSLLMAKRGARVIAMDKNPVAVRYLRENAGRNKVANLEIREGDAAELALEYEGSADHVIMNLPHSASLFLVPAMRAARPGGVVHYYCIAPEEGLYQDLSLIEEAAAHLGKAGEVIYQGVVRSYAPRRHNVVIDFRVIEAPRGLGSAGQSHRRRHQAWNRD